MTVAQAAHYDIIDERSSVAISGAATWTSEVIDAHRYPSLLFEADLNSLTGTSPTARLYIDGSADGLSFGSGDVYAGPQYSAAIAHWGYRGAPAKRFVRIRVVVGGTGPAANVSMVLLGAASS